MSIFKLKIYLCLLMILLLSSCASYHNLNEDGANHLGGGFSDTKLAAGFYKLMARTNFAPWVNFSGAWSTWNSRATKLCGEQEFENFEVEESSYNTIAGEGYVISQVQGFILCAHSDLEKKEIERLVSIN